MAIAIDTIYSYVPECMDTCTHTCTRTCAHTHSGYVMWVTFQVMVITWVPIKLIANAGLVKIMHFTYSIRLNHGTCMHTPRPVVIPHGQENVFQKSRPVNLALILCMGTVAI